MNWRRGFLRLWMVASAAWVLFFSYDLRKTFVANKLSHEALNLPPPVFTIDDWISVAAILVLPSLVALLLGLTFGWISTGFRRLK